MPRSRNPSQAGLSFFFFFGEKNKFPKCFCEMRPRRKMKLNQLASRFFVTSLGLAIWGRERKEMTSFRSKKSLGRPTKTVASNDLLVLIGKVGHARRIQSMELGVKDVKAEQSHLRNCNPRPRTRTGTRTRTRSSHFQTDNGLTTRGINKGQRQKYWALWVPSSWIFLLMIGCQRCQIKFSEIAR